MNASNKNSTSLKFEKIFNTLQKKASKLISEKINAKFSIIQSNKLYDEEEETSRLISNNQDQMQMLDADIKLEVSSSKVNLGWRRASAWENRQNQKRSKEHVWSESHLQTNIRVSFRGVSASRFNPWSHWESGYKSEVNFLEPNKGVQIRN